MAEDGLNTVPSQPAFPYTLNKSERLKSKKIIDGLFNNGSSFFLAPVRVVYKYEEWEEAVPCKVAFTVSKRNFKRAVDRNRVKRLLRETYRLNKKPLHDFIKAQNKKIAVAFIYNATKLPEFNKLNLLMPQIIKKLTVGK